MSDQNASRPLERTETPGIFKRDGSYVVRLRIRGKQVQRSARTLAQARTIRSGLLSDRDRGTYREVTRQTVREYAEEWGAGYQGRTGRGAEPATIKSYRRALELHVLPEIGDRKLAEITPADVKKLAAALRKDGKKPASVQRLLGGLRVMLADAAEEGAIASSPFAAVRLPGAPARPAEERVKALTDEELAALLGAVPEGRERLLMRVMVDTGLRTGEAVALRWGDIGPRQIHVRRAISQDGRVKAPKSAAGTRTVAIPASLGRDLAAVRGADDAYLFPGDGGPMLPRHFAARIFAPAARAAGVPWATPHVLRHSFASRALRSGVNVKQLQVALGHATAAITLTVYSHLLPGDLAPALPEITPAEIVPAEVPVS